MTSSRMLIHHRENDLPEFSILCFFYSLDGSELVFGARKCLHDLIERVVRENTKEFDAEFRRFGISPCIKCLS